MLPCAKAGLIAIGGFRVITNFRCTDIKANNLSAPDTILRLGIQKESHAICRANQTSLGRGINVPASPVQVSRRGWDPGSERADPISACQISFSKWKLPRVKENRVLGDLGMWE